MRNGRRLTSPQLTLMYRNNTLGLPRFAFVVPMQVDKRAVGRNRIKRLLRETVRGVLPQLSGIDGVIIARRGLVGLSLTEVELRVKELLQPLMR